MPHLATPLDYVPPNLLSLLCFGLDPVVYTFASSDRVGFFQRDDFFPLLFHDARCVLRMRTTVLPVAPYSLSSDSGH